MTVNNGVVAFRMDASPLAIRVSAEHDQRQRYHVVQRAHGEKTDPRAGRRGYLIALGEQQQVEGDSRQPHTAEDNGNGRQRFNRSL